MAASGKRLSLIALSTCIKTPRLLHINELIGYQGTEPASREHLHVCALPKTLIHPAKENHHSSRRLNSSQKKDKNRMHIHEQRNLTLLPFFGLKHHPQLKRIHTFEITTLSPNPPSLSTTAKTPTHTLFLPARSPFPNTYHPPIKSNSDTSNARNQDNNAHLQRRFHTSSR